MNPRTTPSERARQARCECGHPRACHYFENNAATAGEGGLCHATVYAEVPMGMSATPCKCVGFKAATDA